MADDLTPTVDKALIGQLGQGDPHISADGQQLRMALQPGLWAWDLPAEEVPAMANTAINQFLTRRGGHEYPSQDFRMEGWVQSTSSQW